MRGNDDTAPGSLPTPSLRENACCVPRTIDSAVIIRLPRKKFLLALEAGERIEDVMDLEDNVGCMVNASWRGVDEGWWQWGDAPTRTQAF